MGSTASASLCSDREVSSSPLLPLSTRELVVACCNLALISIISFLRSSCFLAVFVVVSSLLVFSRYLYSLNFSWKRLLLALMVGRLVLWMKAGDCKSFYDLPCFFRVLAF